MIESNYYTIGIEVTGAISLEVDNEEISSIVGKTVVLLLDRDTNGRLYDYYNAVRTLITNNNKVIVIMDGATSNIRKQICMLMSSYKRYDIYKIDDVSAIDIEYIKEMENRQPSEAEVETFIGIDVAAYSELNELLLKLSKDVTAENINEVAETVRNNKELLENSSSVFDYMKRVIDTNNSAIDTKVKDLTDKLLESEASRKSYEDRVNTEVHNYEAKINELTTELQKMSEIKEMYSTARNRCVELEKSLANSKGTISMYTTTQTSVTKCNVKAIIYFKVISEPKYIKSFIKMLLTRLTKLGKLTARLLIYDVPNAYNKDLYSPLNIIGSEEYARNRNNIVNKYEEMVIVEPNLALLADILRESTDVLIIYDKLKQQDDIIAGNLVNKFWVIDSASELKAISNTMTVPVSKVVTSPGVDRDAIAISELPGYSEATLPGKIFQYYSMQNTGIDGSKVYDLILEDCHLSQLIASNGGK